MSHLPHSTPADGPSAVDFMALLGRCLGNFKIVERVIATFQETGRSDLDQLQMAVEQTDYAAVVEIAHRFKGAASNVSAVGLSKALLRAEVAGREVDHPELVKILADLQSEWDIFMRFAHAFAPATSSAKHGSVIPTQDTSEKRHACASC